MGYERDPHDWYVENQWTSERLFAAWPFAGTIFDPACGSGRILRAARDAGYQTEGWDIVLRNPLLCDRLVDWFSPEANDVPPDCTLISNPPFSRAQEFTELALERVHVACLLLPLQWMAGDRRTRWLAASPLARVWVLTPRPSMPPGQYVEAGGFVGGGKADYAFYHFDRERRHGAPELHWLRRDA